MSLIIVWRLRKNPTVVSNGVDCYTKKITSPFSIVILLCNIYITNFYTCLAHRMYCPNVGCDQTYQLLFSST
jgi:hypothetical protein